MICRKIRLVNFRNVEEQELEFDGGVNVIYGNNAQGKTSVLEGIYLTAQGRSHRTSRERDFIRFGCEYAEIVNTYANRTRNDASQMIRYEDNGRRVCCVNGVSTAKMSEFIGNFRAILFTPEHLSIVKEGPLNRRLFLDTALSQTDPVYLSDLQLYNKNLTNRNKLLQTAEDDRETFDETVEVWSWMLADRGEKISMAREKYLNRLSQVTTEIFADMTGGREKVTFRYRDPRTRDELVKLLKQNIEKEIKNRTTMYGPHKDDIDIDINGRPAREFGSQGQQRSIALAMKLAEGELSKEAGGEYPVFLLDDIMSELDRSRREYVMNGISGRQVIITSCDSGVVRGKARLFLCENGRFSCTAGD